MKDVERRLRALEAAEDMKADPLSMQVWIITPGSTETWLHHSFMAGRPETLTYYKEGERVGRYTPAPDGTRGTVEPRPTKDNNSARRI